MVGTARQPPGTRGQSATPHPAPIGYTYSQWSPIFWSQIFLIGMFENAMFEMGMLKNSVLKMAILSK